MNFEIYIENLGAIDKAEITINPLTILAGENGTGKSFVTKFLYSVLNVLMRDVYRIELITTIASLRQVVNELMIFFNKELKFDNKEFFECYKQLYDFLSNLLDNFNDVSEYDIGVFYSILTKTAVFDDEIIESLKNEVIVFDSPLISYGVIELFKKKSQLVINFLELTPIENSVYNKILKNYIINELKENFQISNIGQIIKKGQEKLIFEVKNIVKIEIVGDDLVVKDFQITNNLSKINRLTFFESPIYWRLSMELIENASRPKNYYLSDKISDERLTGVPKYFLDLRELLFSRFEKGEKEPFIEQCANDLQKNLNGKFNTDSYDLSFETNQGQTINKTLVSFGMTNLGILQAVLNRNIINKGSFVFIDEPESNLHPEWQAVLADILVKLAENGVFVVITTHSSDMLKALDVISQERKNNDEFISVNYFEKGGNLLPLNNNDISPIQQARLKLLETYDEMVLRGYLL